MVRNLLILGLAAALAAPGATIAVNVAGTTATQAILAYTAPDNNPCSVAVSAFSSLSPLVDDVNPALFAGADSDQRAGNIVSGTSRIVVIGQRTAALASDGNYYSRALQALTPYYFTVACGAGTGSGTFTTRNAPLGNSAPDRVPFVLGAWGNQGWPSMSWSDQTQPYIDPLTGLLVKRITGPGQSGGGVATIAATAVTDLAGAWTTPSNILGSSGYASTSSKGQSNALFMPFPISDGYGFAGVSSAAGSVLDDGQAAFSGYTDTSGDNLSACLTVNHGQSCIGTPVSISLPVGSASAAQVSGPSSYPAPLFSGWGSPKITVEQYGNPTGTVNVSGTAVTLASINKTTFFPLSLVAGDHITIAGSSPTCPNNDCTITALVDTSHLTILQSLGTLSGAAFTLPNFGMMVWNAGSSGSVYLQSAQTNVAYSQIFSVGDDGSANFCSVQTVTVNYAADGVTPLSPPETGRICQWLDISGNPALYLFVPQTGEARLLAYGDQVKGNETVGTFDPGNPNMVYYAQNGVSNPSVYRCTYNASAGHYAALPPNYTNASSPNYSCANITSGAGNDLLSQIGRVVSGFNSAYFSRVNLSGAVMGNYVGIQAQLGQGSIAYTCIFDVTQSPGSQIVGCHDTWSTYPERWGGAHGGFQMETSAGWGDIFLVPLASQGATGIGLYQFSVDSISGESGTTALTSTVASDPTTQSCSSLGVTDPRWIALGATGNNCLQMVVASEPQNVAPSPADRAQWPSACNPNYAQLQTIQPGDYLYDNANGLFGEQFLVAGKTGSGCSPITLVLSRGATQQCAAAPQAHANGWTPIVTATQNCDGNNYWINASAPGLAYADNAGVYSGHTFTGPADSTGTNLVTYTVYGASAGYAGYGARQGSLPTLIGQPYQYGVNMIYPFNGAGTPLQGPGVTINQVQAHPGGQSYLATPPTLGYDGRPLGGAGGGIGTVWYHTLTPVAGQTNTYQISCALSAASGGSCLDSLDRKRLGMVAFAGRFMLTDISGPGSSITDAHPYTYCIADFAGECVAGSSAGNRYVSVPDINTSGVCIVGALDQNTPCLATAPAGTAQATQYNWGAADPNALNWRRLGYAFNGPGQTNNYWNVHGIADGSWAFTEVDWKEGVRKDIVAIQLPPWPPADTVNRTGYVQAQVPVGLTGNTGDTVRVEFGYQDFGAPNTLYCTSRAEACFTSSSATQSNPFVWASETQSYTSCGSTCTVNVPARSTEMLYYRVHRKNAAGVEVTGPVQVLAVP